MQIAASFIEYLVSGCSALVWLVVMFEPLATLLKGANPGHIVLTLPVVYAVGMIIDLVSKTMVAPIERFTRGRYPSSLGADHSELAFLIFHSPELGKEYALRSSRDRIARGAILNSLLLSISCAIRAWREGNSDFVRYSWIALALSFVCMILWYRFELLSRRFKHDAVRVILADQQENRASSGTEATQPR